MNHDGIGDNFRVRGILFEREARIARVHSVTTTTMPKAPSSLPISGLFAVAKPSGPPSMTVVNDIKKLLTASRLFVEAEKLKKQIAKGKQKRGRFSKDVVKIGQGGTLDPLADGVLGE